MIAIIALLVILVLVRLDSCVWVKIKVVSAIRDALNQEYGISRITGSKEFAIATVARMELFDSVSLLTMILKFWKRPESFYDIKRFCFPEEVERSLTYHIHK